MTRTWSRWWNDAEWKRNRDDGRREAMVGGVQWERGVMNYDPYISECVHDFRLYIFPIPHRLSNAAMYGS